MSTASEMVDTLDTAISAIVGRQAASYTIDGVTYTAHDLDKLRALRRMYAGEEAIENADTNDTFPFLIHKLEAGDGK